MAVNVLRKRIQGRELDESSLEQVPVMRSFEQLYLTFRHRNFLLNFSTLCI